MVLVLVSCRSQAATSFCELGLQSLLVFNGRENLFPDGLDRHGLDLFLLADTKFGDLSFGQSAQEVSAQNRLVS